MLAGPRLRSEAQHIDTLVSFIQHGASRRRIKSLFCLRWSEAETARFFPLIIILHVDQYPFKDRRLKIALATHTYSLSCCN